MSAVNTTAQFSITLDILGKVIPLNSGDISSLPTKTEATNALDDLIKKGLSFSTPADFRLNLPLENFVTWLDGKGYSLPDGLTDFFDQTSITIFHASMSTKGDFSFSFEVDFNPALGSDLTNGMFSISDIGLAISHTAASA